MGKRDPGVRCRLAALALCVFSGLAAGQEATTRPTKVYVPYEKLKGVFESESQGVFLPYREFHRLWRAASGVPAAVRAAPEPYLISTARVTGRVGEEIARMQLELTVDILAEGWVEVPIGLGDVAVARASFADAGGAKPLPLLRVVDGQYRLLTRGAGRRVLRVEFVRQLVAAPGLKVLSYRTPAAAISTLELHIPEENMKVDVAPMLAATTTQEELDGRKGTRLQAFLGSTRQVKLSWKPKTQAAAELEPVVIAEQLQHIHVAEALVSHDVTFNYDIRRRGVDAFTVQLPDGFRVTAVEGANISKWDIAAVPAAGGRPARQNLRVTLFAPVKDAYRLSVRMERFLTETKVQIPLSPILTQQVLRRTGILAITHSPRRSVEAGGLKDLARVDAGRLPAALRKRPGVMAYRFISADYAAVLSIAAVDPRISVRQLWALGVRGDRAELHGRLGYRIERAGVFQLSMELPEPWEIVSLGPPGLIDDHQLSGAGAGRRLTILLKRELTGSFTLEIVARAPRAKPDAQVDFLLPRADPKNLRLYDGELLLLVAEQFRTEADGLDQLQALPLNKATRWAKMPGLSAAMAFEFRAIDRAAKAGARFKIAVKPAQVSAVVHRLVNIQPGSVRQQAVIQYLIRYAPVDTLYLKMPAALADAGVQITGRDIKEKPRIAALPADQRPAPPATAPAGGGRDVTWGYYKVVLQSPVIGTYQLHVHLRRSFQAGEAGKAATVTVEPILAAGKLSDQSGHVAVAKADTLAVGEPTSTGLIPADAASDADLPYEPHRRQAFLAFKYAAGEFTLSLPVLTQEEAAVFATIVSGVVVEQVLARDGTLNAHVSYILATSRGDRLAVRLPAGAKLFAVLLNGSEAPVEAGASAEERIVRLPPSPGQVAKFVLQVSYGLEKASASRLTVPALPEGIPVQQSLWRLWVPVEDHVLAFDRDFSRLRPYQAQGTLSAMNQGQPAEVAFKLAPQGQQLDFIRQGPPRELSVTLVDKEVFGIALWALILAAGGGMLKLRGFRRCLIVLAGLVGASIVRMFAPLLVRQVFFVGVWPGVIVLLLWAAHWLFVARPRARSASPPGQPPPGDLPAVPPSADEDPSGKEG